MGKENKLTYAEQLLTPEWKKRRLEILTLDGFKCKKCGSTHVLQVHHKKYIGSRMAWEYEDKYLITLCRDCHKKEHRIDKNGNKIKQPPTPKYKQKKKKNKPPKKKTETRIERLTKECKLTNRDKDLQKRYDKLRSEGKIK